MTSPPHKIAYVVVCMFAASKFILNGLVPALASCTKKQ